MKGRGPKPQVRTTCWLRRSGTDYSTRINNILRAVMSRAR